MSLLDPENLESAIKRNKRAVDALEEAELSIKDAESDGLMSKQKKTRFEKEMKEVHQLLWRLSCVVNKSVKSIRPLRVQSRSLRLKFLAYSYQSDENVEAVGG